MNAIDSLMPIARCTTLKFSFLTVLILFLNGQDGTDSHAIPTWGERASVHPVDNHKT